VGNSVGRSARRAQDQARSTSSSHACRASRTELCR
jgi:hypothetical protein